MFEMKKFCSMCIDGSDGVGYWLIVCDDDCVMCVGCFICKISIDEIL